MKNLFTIGYEGTRLEDFLTTLRAANIDLLVDVREIPISRRRGFSKTAIGQALEASGICYRHEKQLGSPKTIRHKLREDGNYARFFKAFEQHLAKQRSLLQMLTKELKGNVALMCYEKDHDSCHRNLVAAALSAMLGKPPIHLGVGDYAGEAPEASRPHSRQSFSAA